MDSVGRRCWQKEYYWLEKCGRLSPELSAACKRERGVLTILESGLSTRAGVEFLPVLGNLGLGPVCGDWGWRSVYGKSMMGMELQDNNPEASAQKHSHPHDTKTKCGLGAPSFNTETHTDTHTPSFCEFP